MIERHFDDELKALKQRLVEMGTRSEESVRLAMMTLTARRESLAEEVFRMEQKINADEMEIEEEALRLIAQHQPVAKDLRFLTSTIKIINELERIGDLAVNITEVALDLMKQPLLKPLIDLPRMANIASQMVKDSLDAFISDDSRKAKSVCERDDEVDSLNDQVFRELITYMIQDPANIKRAVDLILVARHLERIADHATNISENVFYIVEGKTIKHHHLVD
jgi:phosphate transport system protein